MNDDLDIYVSLSLKNWSAKNGPPRDGRIQLLRDLTTPQPQKARWYARMWSALKSSLHTSQNIVIFYDSWLCDPFPQSQNWVSHIAASWRLSH